MSFHTGVSLFILLSSIVFSGVTGKLEALPLLCAILYGFNIKQDKIKTVENEAVLTKKFDDEIKLLQTKIDNNRTNGEVIIKALRTDLTEVVSKIGEIRLSAASVKSQQSVNEQRYKF